jgi:cytochrome P450
MLLDLKETSYAYLLYETGICLITMIGLYLIMYILQQYLKLSHVPGPFLARFSGVWLVSKFYHKEKFTLIALDLDKKYGPVVRYGPRSVLLSDPAAIPIVYGSSKPWRKVSNPILKLSNLGLGYNVITPKNQAVSYEVAQPLVNGKILDSFVTTRDETRVSGIKKHINSAFTATAISDYEHHVNATLQQLKENIRSAGPETNLAKWITLFAFDTICRIAFSDDKIAQHDIDATLKGSRERFTHWHFWLALPSLERLLYKNSFMRGVAEPSLLGMRAHAKVQDRGAEYGQGTHSDLLDHYLKANVKAPELFSQETVVGLVISTIHAGSETTSATLNITLYHLLQNPRTLAKLREEAESANLSSPPSYQSVSKLRYLEAVIKEAMRMSSTNSDPLEREVPPGGVNVSGVFLPGGTAVAINAQVLIYNEDVWGPSPESYNPDRWLDANQTQKAKMERTFLGFGQGKRMCIGQHIAWSEMKKVLPDVLLNFEVCSPIRSRYTPNLISCKVLPH